ncbi:MAG TPA: ATP-binding protein [Azonexus sp.]|nr:ATP-binding protein [Azonexus sp.]
MTEPSEQGLRRQAEQKLAGQTPNLSCCEADAPRLLHELQVHQIELEMQNEVLRQTLHELEESRNLYAKRYADLYEFAAVGYVTFNQSGLIAECNLTAATLLGVDRQKLLRRRFDDFVATDDRQRWQEFFVGAMEGVGAGGRTTEVRLQTAASTLLVHLDGCPLENNDARSGLRIAMTDITARWQAELAMQASRAEAERANNAKSRFLAAASHDLRQPLVALRLYTDTLKNKVAPGDQALVMGMEDCILGLSGLLTNLLDLSKLEAGVVKPKIDDFSVFEFFASLESIYAPEARTKGLRLHVVPTRLIGCCDAILLTRIVGNFIDNAIRYTARGGVVVGCRRRQGKLWIEVWDSGIGIAANNTAVIFEEFRQLDDGADKKGSGLGLAIVAKVAALLGLEISVRSWPGRGSVFAIELPCGKAQEVSTPTAGEPACRPLRIAIVDDNALVRQAMTAALQGLGHQVIDAPNGWALLLRLAGFHPDIIVSDYRLAYGENGYDVISAARREIGAELPALIITGDTNPALIAEMSERGIFVLHKPFDSLKLQACLENLTSANC